MDEIVATLTMLLVHVPSFVLAGLLLLGGLWFFAFTSGVRRFHTDPSAGRVRAFQRELMRRDNPAFGILVGGYAVGLGVAMSGTLFGLGEDPWQMLQAVLGLGVAAALLMRISVILNDKAILFRFSNLKEIVQDRHKGVAFVMAGHCLATGLILSGAFSGDTPPGSADALPRWLIGLRDVVVYWLVGQAVLIAGGRAFCLVAGYKVQQMLAEQDSPAIGVAMGGMLAAQGIIAKASLNGASGNLGAEVLVTLVLASVGVALLSTAGLIFRLIFGRRQVHEIVRDKNAAAGVVMAAIFVVIALLAAGAISASVASAQARAARAFEPPPYSAPATGANVAP
ncbi:MAG: hypothetical protein NTV86_18835 [Planctomycetota bacterium]|nr:hypothetical protein [Planctomycetota bacterium]